MSVLQKLSCYQDGRSDKPNQKLARELVEQKNIKGIVEIAENLWNKDEKIRKDCILVLYWIGTIRPELIEDYVSDFLELLYNNGSRHIWETMIALSTIAERKPDEIYNNLNAIVRLIENGSVITVDNGIRILATVASVNIKYNRAIFPFLIEHLKRCRPKDVPQHAESIFPAVNPENKNEFLEILEERTIDLNRNQLARINKIFKRINTIETEEKYVSLHDY